MSELRNCNKNFMRDVTFDNIKSHKKPGLHTLSRRYIFGKTTGGGGVKLTPTQPFKS